MFCSLLCHGLCSTVHCTMDYVPQFTAPWIMLHSLMSHGLCSSYCAIDYVPVTVPWIMFHNVQCRGLCSPIHSAMDYVQQCTVPWIMPLSTIRESCTWKYCAMGYILWALWHKLNSLKCEVVDYVKQWTMSWIVLLDERCNGLCTWKYCAVDNGSQCTVINYVVWCAVSLGLCFWKYYA